MLHVYLHTQICIFTYIFTESILNHNVKYLISIAIIKKEKNIRLKTYK